MRHPWYSYDYNPIVGYQILYLNASGDTAMTSTIICGSAQKAFESTTDFVRANFLGIYLVDASLLG